jgi:nucleoside-diphosphate-sugar epimerase
MNVMITGAAGGIGSTLALELTRKGCKVIAIDNLANGYIENLYEDGKRFCTFFDRDIRDDISIPYTLEKEKIDIVIHLAAITSLPSAEGNPFDTISVNVGGTAAILDAVRKSNVKRTIIASTSAIYENTMNWCKAPLKEDVEVSPRLMYPLSKKMMEDVIESYKVNYGLDIVTLRFFNIFGPLQDIHSKSPPLINYITRCVHEGIEPTFYSDGTQQRDYVHVDDVVEMISLCMVVPEAAGEVFNVCTNTLTSVKDIIGYAEKAYGKFEYKFLPSEKYWGDYTILHHGANPLKPEIIAKEVNKYAVGCFNKARTILGWNPNTNIEELMIKTFKESLERIYK